MRVPVEPPEAGLIVDAIEELWHTQRKFPNLSDVASKTGLSTEKVESALSQRWVRDSLSNRGIASGTGLSPIQLAVANVLVDATDTRRISVKLKDIGVSTQTYQGWLKNPAFADYLRLRAESLLPDGLSEVMIALQQKAASGHLESIKYLMDFTGRFRPKEQAQVDVQVILSRILEIIDRRVKDPETKELIAADLLALAPNKAIPSIVVREFDDLQEFSY